jgi:hypothetical protein
MLPTEHARFCQLISLTLTAYAKKPSEDDLETWWRECKNLTMEGVESALKSHREDPDRGERAPRPVDITRRMKAGSRDSARCAARDATGQCEYPGIFSEGTSGDGPWYCPWHRQDHMGPEAARWIEISHQIPYAEARAKRIDRMNEEAQRAPGAVATSHAIALRHGNKPWQPATRMQWPGGLSPDEETLVPRQPGEDAEAA